MRQAPDARTRRPGKTIKTWLLGSVLAMSLTAFASPSHAARTVHKPQGTQATIPAKAPLHHVTLRQAADNTPTRNIHHAVFLHRVADNSPTGKLGVRVPLVPGVIPILSAPGIVKFTQKCGAKIPPPLLARLDELGTNDEAAAEFGIEYATKQCEELLRAGAPGLHFYTLNKSRSTVQVLKNLGLA